jgi:cell wall-associated NlpC family hydrolase
MRMPRAITCLLALLCALGATAQQAVAEGAQATGKVIGKLGQAIEATEIRSTPGAKAKVYYRTKQFQYLVIKPTKYEKWLAVLLQNGRDGYILAEKVARLPYDVRMNDAPAKRPAGSATSRQGIRNGVAADGAKADMLRLSFEYVGTPYRWGGNSLTNGVDCSGFVQQLFGKIGVSLPRTAAEQAYHGTPVPRLEDLRAGDRLYFWDSKRGKIGHTGIFLGYYADGGAYFIHSSSNNKGVDTDDLRRDYWRNMLVAARRD